MSAFVSRGFTGRRRTSAELRVRLPPGQYAEQGFPVLTAGPTPDVPVGEWRLRIDGMVARPQEWTWEQFAQLPFEAVRCDIHCVTKWSKLDTSFGGVSLDTLLAQVEPRGSYAMAWSHGGYTTNLSIDDPRAARRGSSPSMRAIGSRTSTGARLACSSRTCTSGRAPSGLKA